MKYVVYVGVGDLAKTKIEAYLKATRDNFRDFFDSWDRVVYIPRRGHDTEVVMLPHERNPDPDRYKLTTVPRGIINDILSPGTPD